MKSSLFRLNILRLLAVGAFWVTGLPLQAGSVSLGDAQGFAVLAGSTVTNTGPTTLFGDLGVSPGTAITGFLPGTYSGTIHLNDALAISAQVDALTAYNQLLGLPVNQILSGQDLGGLTLTPGVYQFETSAQLTGTLTLDGLGLINPLFVFQIGSTLTTADFSIMDAINGADADNIYFQVGSSATLGTDSVFQGDLISFTSNTLTTGASVDGHVIALNGAVTLDSNMIAVPEPSSLMLVLGGVCGLMLRRKRA